MKSNKQEKALRKEIIETAQLMNKLGITINESGNVSARAAMDNHKGFLITPSAIPYDNLSPKEINFIWSEKEASHHEGPYPPSTEWMLHSHIYQNRPDVKAIVHTHSPNATALSCRDKPIPPFHPSVAALGGKEIACSEYATMGTYELAKKCVEALGNTMGCLISHHGVVACGDNLHQALAYALEIENIATMWTVLLKIGGGKMIPEAEMDVILEKYKARSHKYV